MISSFHILSCLTAVACVGATAIGNQQAKQVSSNHGLPLAVEVSSMGGFAQTSSDLLSGALSSTDALALEMRSKPFKKVATHGSLLRVDAHEGNCELPAGAKWCTAHSGDKSWQMAVYAGSDPVSNTICSTGFWEHSDPAAMGIAAGDQLLDIGANVGWYTFMFAQHGYKVLAIEPMTANRALLNATMCKNPDLVPKITVVAAALTDKVDKPDQKCSIFSADINLGDGILACNDKQIAGVLAPRKGYHHILREKVPLTTLDEVLASSKLNHIDVMKMDVERFECGVLDGGSTLFTDSRFRPKGLMIESRTKSEEDNTKAVQSGDIGSTTHCTVEAVMKGGSYTIRKDNIAGPVIEEPTNVGILNLYFAAEQR